VELGQLCFLTRRGKVQRRCYINKCSKTFKSCQKLSKTFEKSSETKEKSVETFKRIQKFLNVLVRCGLFVVRREDFRGWENGRTGGANSKLFGVES